MEAIKSRTLRISGHLLGVLLTAFVIFELTVIPFGGFKPRNFRMVQVESSDGPYAGGRVLVKIRSIHDGAEGSTTIPPSDKAILKPGTTALLMSADWNIKGPAEQRVTFWRLLTAYHFFLPVLYLTWVLAIIFRYFISKDPKARGQAI